jgi:soluble lytic murein transglycosylase-like protein
MKRLTIAFLLTCIFVSSIGSAELSIIQESNRIRVQKLQNYYKSIGKHVNRNVIEEILSAIDKYRLKYFPNGPFTRQDFIALAMAESDFHQYEVGSSGEVGVFQIMRANISKGIDNPFELNINTRLAMKVLRWKFEEHKDYKKAIIAYNGLVYRKGKLSEKYWKAFQKRKTILAQFEVE